MSAQRRVKWRSLVWTACVWLSVSSSAHAFSDQERFAEDAAKGGGGGRYFTGSPSDGFGCSVCHRGGDAPNVQIRGLPDDFLAGTTYDIELTWDAPTLAHALTLELVTGQGQAAGVIALAEDTQISAQERCKAQATEAAAATIHSPAGRQVLSVRECGASLVRFRWTAPQASEVTFAASIVRSDVSATPEGDGVSELSRTLLPVGAARPSSDGCAASNSPHRTTLPYGLLTIAAFLVRRRRRKLT